MSSIPKRFLNAEEYLALERRSQLRSEFDQGEMFATTGASRKHNLITLNIARRISEAFDNRPCETYSNDMRVKVSLSGLYTYPNVVATCKSPQFEDDLVDTLLNPQAIVEVQRESTESYDRGKKFSHYRRIPSLKDYLLVSQDHVMVEHYMRQPNNRWLLTEAFQLEDSVNILSIDCRLRLADIYAKVNLSLPELEDTRKMNQSVSKSDLSALDSISGERHTENYQS